MRKLFAFLFIVVVVSGLALADNYTAGLGAGGNILSGYADYNVLIGQCAGYGLTTGDYNIKLGFYADRADSNGSNRFVVQRYLYTVLLQGDMVNGYLGINNASPSVALDVTGDALISGTLGLTGNLTLDGNVIASSDTIALSAEAVVEHASEADTSSVVFVGGKANVYGTDGDMYSIGITTGDAANFTGASGGYSFDDGIKLTGTIGTDITLQNGETIANNTNNVIAFSGKVIKFPLNAALPDTTGFTGGELWLSAIGDTTYVYMSNHTIRTQP